MAQQQQATPAVTPAPETAAPTPSAGAGTSNSAVQADLGLTSGGPSSAASPNAQSLLEQTELLSQPVYGPQDLAHAVNPGSGVGIGGFEATYIPLLETLIVRVTGKVQFKDAVTGAHPALATEHTDLSPLVTFLNSLDPATAAQIIPYYQWDATAKAEKLALFNTRLTEATSIWENAGLHFEVNDPAWTDTRATPSFFLQVGEEGTAGAGEHLQVSIYKEPSDTEKAAIDAILGAASLPAMQPGISGIRANAGTNVGSNAPGATGNATDENPFQNEMSLSSADLDAAPDPNERGGNNLLKRTILFDNNVDTLTSAQISDIQTWIVQFNDGDANAGNNGITLRGYASASGAADYNTALADRRIAAVQAAIVGAGVSAGRITSDNHGNTEAHTEVGQDEASQDNERRVEIRIGSGERQNTVAHEMGHVFGLSDEYAEGSRTAGQTSWQDPTVTGAGVATGSKIENNDGMISMGNEVRPQHYVTFAWALNQLTASKLNGRAWNVV